MIRKTNVVIVSGSSGLIGSALILKMASQYNMVGLDNVGYPFPPPEAECVCLDITSDTNMDFHSNLKMWLIRERYIHYEKELLPSYWFSLSVQFHTCSKKGDSF